MILDQMKHLQDYKGMGFDSTKILEFVQKAEKEPLAEGRYELDGENLFAMIQIYETKDREECLYEAHQTYMDIQYMAEGAELMFVSSVETLQVVEDRTPEEDLLFYAQAPEEASLLVRQGSFALFLPQDGHMPCCKYKEKSKVKKIVFKVRIH